MGDRDEITTLGVELAKPPNDGRHGESKVPPSGGAFTLQSREAILKSIEVQRSPILSSHEFLG
jgi:hypothetical protein